MVGRVGCKRAVRAVGSGNKTCQVFCGRIKTTCGNSKICENIAVQGLCCGASAGGCRVQIALWIDCYRLVCGWVGDNRRCWKAAPAACAVLENVRQERAAQTSSKPGKSIGVDNAIRKALRRKVARELP